MSGLVAVSNMVRQKRCRIRFGQRLAQDGGGVGLIPVLQIAGVIVGSEEGFAGSAYDTDIRAAQSADLHQQPEGVSWVYGQGEGSDETGFVGDAQSFGHLPAPCRSDVIGGYPPTRQPAAVAALSLRVGKNERKDA